MKRSSHLLKSSNGLGASGGGPGTRTVKVGTFGDRRLPQGKKSQYSFTVEEGGKIEPGSEFNPNTDQINGRTASGAMFGPGGYDDYQVTGQVVSAQAGPELQRKGIGIEPPAYSGGGGGGSKNGGGSQNGGGTQNGSGQNNQGSNQGSNQNGGGNQEAGIGTGTILLGIGAVTVAGVAAMSLGGDGSAPPAR